MTIRTSLGMCLLLTAWLGATGCSKGNGQEATATPYVAKGAGIVGTWSGTYTDPENPLKQSGTAGAKFKSDGTYERSLTAGNVTMTFFGKYKYDASQKSLATSIERGDISGGMGKIKGISQPMSKADPVQWAGSDSLSFKTGSVTYTLTRK